MNREQRIARAMKGIARIRHRQFMEREAARLAAYARANPDCRLPSVFGVLRMNPSCDELLQYATPEDRPTLRRLLGLRHDDYMAELARREQERAKLYPTFAASQAKARRWWLW